jgi:hypothetical protein
MPSRHFVRASAALLAATALVTAQDPKAGASNDPTNVDEPHGAMLERLSSGAIRSLDENGNLVDWSGANAIAAPDVALDPRVGGNIRLGDDPAALPANLRAQAEPHIARSPVDPNFLVATFQEGRFTDGSAVNCGYSVSRDGGVTWTRALIPGLTASSGGSYPRVTDPVAAIGLNNYAYLNTLAAGSSTRVGDILVNRSTDGGATFGPPVIAYRAPSVNVFPDKNWITVNTFANTPTAGRIVVTFTAFPAPGQQGPTPIMRVYSDDHGVTWSQPALIHASTKNTQGSQPVFLPDGKLAVVYWNFNGSDPSDDALELVVSNDGGITFGAPMLVQAVNFYDHPQIRDGGILPSASVDRVNGNLYVTYQATVNGISRILFTRSGNAGATWSTPIAVTDNPAGSGVFNAAIGNSYDGQTLTIVHYSNRDNPTSNTLVDVYLAQSFDNGNTWQPNIRLTSVSTDATLSPLTPAGYMLGDYIGIAESTSPNVPAVPVWIDNRTGNPDPFVARVRMAGSSVAKADFNANFQADVVWQNNSTGQRAIWLMNGTDWVGERFLPTVPTEWQIVTTADFNADAHTDIVWQNVSTGQRAIWLMNGTTWVGEHFLPTVPTEWAIRASGDFNSDGHPDLLWQNNNTGARAIWLMDGTTWVAERFLPTIPTEWQIVGADELNGDGEVDILWENTVTGARAIWLMNDTAWVGERFLPTIPTQWRIAGTGEFNGDAHTDIVWQNNLTGQRAIWLMNGTNWVGERFLPTIPLEWQMRNH